MKALSLRSGEIHTGIMPGLGAWAAIALVGACAAILDLVVAIVWWQSHGATPIDILHSVAAWATGHETAAAGGWRTAAFGAALQLYLMTAMVAVYVAASRPWALLHRRPLAMGSSYGALAYVLQHVLVIPLLSAAPPTTFRPGWMLACVISYMVLLGVPTGLLARRLRAGHA